MKVRYYAQTKINVKGYNAEIIIIFLESFAFFSDIYRKGRRLRSIRQAIQSASEDNRRGSMPHFLSLGYNRGMHTADENRYSKIGYRRAGASGLLLSELALGLWQNFGAEADDSETRKIITLAFDSGITYFDLADNYGPPAGSAEQRFGRILASDLASYRDEIVIATKAGFECWPGPYGNWGSKKHLTASIDRSLRNLGVDYVDIFYHHRPDPRTPIDETAEALASIARSGKALYIGLSKYTPAEAALMCRSLERFSIRPIVDQVRYSIYDRTVENYTLSVALENLGMSAVVFSPLAQGILTGKYLSGIPAGSRGESNDRVRSMLTPEAIQSLLRLQSLASERGVSMTELSISWLLSRGNIASVIAGARNADQLAADIRALSVSRDFTAEEESLIASLFPPVYGKGLL